MNLSAGCVHIIQNGVCVGLDSLLVKFERIDLLTSIFAVPLYSTNSTMQELFTGTITHI
tara:strand:- start:1054 stop:1230 length:177 start_codon:yes stop_codon:yes gene_type:complete